MSYRHWNPVHLQDPVMEYTAVPSKYNTHFMNFKAHNKAIILKIRLIFDVQDTYSD